MIQLNLHEYSWMPDSDVKMNFNPHVLITYVNDCFYAEQELQQFLKSWTGGWWLHKTAQEREDYTKYNERSNYMWRALTDICRMLGIDQERLIAIVKAMNRYEKNQLKYDRCVHINEKQFLKAVLVSDAWEKQYFKSTGRRMKCVEESI